MSYQALQRVMVRMHFDPAFVTAVFEAPAEALADVTLSVQEQRWLLATDRRAFGTDPMRRWRLLTVLLEEFAACCALSVRHLGGVRAIETFFASPQFHHAIQQRTSLATAFPAWLRERVDRPEVVAMSRVETAIARARRPPPPWRDGATLRWACGVAAFRAAAGTASAWPRVMGQLAATGRAPLEALIAGASATAPDGWAAGGEVLEYGLVQDDAISLVSEPLYALIAAARDGTDAAHMAHVAARYDATPREATELVAELVADGVLERRD